MAVHKASTDALHYFALLSVETLVCKYMTCFSVIVGKKNTTNYTTHSEATTEKIIIFIDKNAPLSADIVQICHLQTVHRIVSSYFVYTVPQVTEANGVRVPVFQRDLCEF